MNSKLLYFILFLFPLKSWAKLHVVTTFPEFAEIASRVGGSKVQAESLLEGTEDVHHQDALPSHILKLKNADIICFAGLDLEIGWLPRLIMKSSNPHIHSGQKGSCEIGKFITPLEKPQGIINRSFGDIHAGGNPHYNLGLDSLIEAAQYITKVLSMNDPKHSDYFKTNLLKLEEELKNLKIELKAKISKPVTAMQYHQEFSYFFYNFNIDNKGSIEDKPGVPPSAARLLNVAKFASDQKVKIVYSSYFAPEKTVVRFQELSKIKVLKMPTAVIKNNPKLNTIEKVQRYLVENLPK